VSRDYAEQNLYLQRQEGQCLSFGMEAGVDLQVARHDSWESILGKLPDRWRPDLLVLHLQYNCIPPALWQAPVPIVGLAGDWNLQWHSYRRLLPFCDLVLTDTVGVETLHRAGITHARKANLFGLSRAFADAHWPTVERDIDILFVGNFHPAVQRERLQYLGRLAALSNRWNVSLRAGVFGEEYRKLLGRARIVFNRAIRGECNLRAFEAVSAGALLFQEADNREVPFYLRDREEYIAYRADNLEALVERYLRDEPERARLAYAARARVSEFTYARFWKEQLDRIEVDWPALLERATHRCQRAMSPDWLGEIWQAMSYTAPIDPKLRMELAATVTEQPRDAARLNALGVVALASPHGGSEALGDAAHAFQNAWTADPRRAVAGLNLAEALVALGQLQNAAEQAQRVLTVLDETGRLSLDTFDDLHFSHGFDLLRVEWERAAWQNAGDPDGEAQVKEGLLRWQLHTLLGELTGDPLHHYAACVIHPEFDATRSTLAAALVKKGQHSQALPHLEEAVRRNPFNNSAAAAMHDVLGQLGLAARQQALARSRRRLCAAAPELVPFDPKFAEAAPAVDVCAEPASPPLRIVWQGAQDAVHSLALVNRELCSALVARGHQLSLRPPSGYGLPGNKIPVPAILADRTMAPLTGVADVHVTHQWPPDFNPPAQGRWVVIQPWEFGSIPKAWLAPLRDRVDELWVPSAFVRNCFVQDGVPAAKVHVVPNGVGDIFLNDAGNPHPLRTRKRFKFLFVGGTLPRKGIDLLLKAYRQVFSAKQDVCLVIKDMGVGTFYQGQTCEALIEQVRRIPAAPEIEYIPDELTEAQMAGLYRACDCLVQPYRGEGFCLPVAEAMACGRPVIVTGFGPSLDFCTDETSFLLPYRIVRLADKRVGETETVDIPFLAEPAQDALRHRLRYVFEHREEARACGNRAREYVRGRLTWAHAAAVAEKRLVALRDARSAPFAATRLATGARPKVSLTMIVKNEEENLEACLKTVADLVDEIIVVDTGSTDRTVEIALRLGAKVFHFPWIDHFAAARNESLRYATGEWALWMDADDRIDDVNREKLHRLFAALPDENVAFVIKCLCLPDKESGSATVVDHIRLFRNLPGLSWEHRIHEQILPALRRLGAMPRWSDVVVNHVGYVDPATRQRKMERDLRILKLEHSEMPEHPFTLFNLGSVYRDMGQTAEALDLFRQSLRHSVPGDSIVRKLYSLVSQCERQLKRPGDALTTCQQGRAYYADDAEILFQESLALHDLGNVPGAIVCLERLIGGSDEEHFASVDTGVRGYKARNNLAAYYKKVGRLDEAESQWRLVLGEYPAFVPALFGLGDLCVTRRDWATLDGIIVQLEAIPQAAVEAEVFRGRAHQTRGEFGAARVVLEGAIRAYPQALSPRVVLSHVLLQEGRDMTAAEHVLRAILEIYPGHAESRKNLDVLLLQQGRKAV
jgi:glycosyltransferase involved in cell wall biosynthesis/tetratricopeptide (TPR) repeat protein